MAQQAWSDPRWPRPSMPTFWLPLWVETVEFDHSIWEAEFDATTLGSEIHEQLQRNYPQPERFQTIYEVLDDWFGERFTLEHVRRLRDWNMPVEQAEELFSRYLDWVAQYRVTPEPTNGVRPFMPLVTLYDFTRMTDQFDRQWDRKSDQLRMLLLYAHGVVLPLPFELGFRDLACVPPDPWVDSDMSCLVWPAFDLLAELRPLAELGVVHWVPPRMPGVPWPYWFHDYDGWVAPQVRDLDVPRSRQPRSVVLRADLAEAAAAGSAAQFGEGSLLLRDRLLEQVVQRFIDPCQRADERMLNHLFRLSLPVAPQASFDDIARVRENETVFHEWRSALGGALQMLDERELDDKEEHRRLRGAVAEYLNAPAERLAAQIHSTSALGMIRGAAKGMVLSGLSAASGGLAAGRALHLRELAANQATGAVAGALASYASHLRSRRTDRALLAHYLTFGSWC